MLLFRLSQKTVLTAFDLVHLTEMVFQLSDYNGKLCDSFRNANCWLPLLLQGVMSVCTFMHNLNLVWTQFPCSMISPPPPFLQF